MSQLKDNRPVERKHVRGLVENEMTMLGLETIPFWITGSYRRGKMLCNDIDVIILLEKSDVRPMVIDRFINRFGSLITDPFSPKTNIVDGQVAYQFHLTDKVRLGAMLLHTTGSVDFNIMFRGIAKSRGLKMNQYGLYKEEEEILISETEQQFFKYLGIGYIEPFNRG